MTNSRHNVVVIGGGAAGIATAASMLKRRPGLDIAIVEPSSTHAYQPGWTMVGGGVFDVGTTIRPMGSVMPKAATWVKQSCASFQPDKNQVALVDGSTLAPSFPTWLVDGTKPARVSWMLKGREWLAGPGGLIAQ